MPQRGPRVDEQRDPGPARRLVHGRDRLAGPDLAVGGLERGEGHAGAADGVRHPRGVDAAGPVHPDDLPLQTTVLRGVQDGGTLDGADDDPTPRAVTRAGERGDGRVQGDGVVGGEDDLLRARAERAGDGLPGAVEQRRRTPALRVEPTGSAQPSSSARSKASRASGCQGRGPVVEKHPVIGGGVCHMASRARAGRRGAGDVRVGAARASAGRRSGSGARRRIVALARPATRCLRESEGPTGTLPRCPVARWCGKDLTDSGRVCRTHR